MASKKKKKKLKLNRLREKAFGFLSKYKRRLAANKNGYALCVTCDPHDQKSLRPWKELHGGHYYHGHSNASYLEENNVWPQCVACNTYKSGNLIEYGRFLSRVIGNDEMERIRRLKFMSWKPTREYYEQKLEEYKNMLEDLGGDK